MSGAEVWVDASHVVGVHCMPMSTDQGVSVNCLGDSLWKGEDFVELGELQLGNSSSESTGFTILAKS